MGALSSLTNLAPILAQTPSQEGEVDPSEIVNTEEIVHGCRANPSFLCEWVQDVTGNEFAADAVAFFIDRPLKIVLIIVGSWLIGRLVRRGISRVVRRVKSTSGRIADVDAAGPQRARLRADQRAEALSSVFRSIATVAIWTIAIMLVLGQLGINLAPLLAGAGIAGLAIGFGAQSLVKDWVAGIFMLIEDQYGVGDIIDVGRASGTVEKVTLRETVIRDLDGTVWHVPNGQISEVGNKSQYWSRALLDIGVAYGTDLRHAQEVIKEIADAMRADDDWASMIRDEPEVWGVQNLAADSVNIRLVVETAPSEQWKVERELRLRIKEAFDAAGIEIPFPQRTIWVRNDSAPALDITDTDADLSPHAASKPEHEPG